MIKNFEKNAGWPIAIITGVIISILFGGYTIQSVICAFTSPFLGCIYAHHLIKSEFLLVCISIVERHEIMQQYNV